MLDKCYKLLTRVHIYHTYFTTSFTREINTLVWAYDSEVSHIFHYIYDDFMYGSKHKTILDGFTYENGKRNRRRPYFAILV